MKSCILLERLQWAVPNLKVYNLFSSKTIGFCSCLMQMFRSKHNLELSSGFLQWDYGIDQFHVSIHFLVDVNMSCFVNISLHSCKTDSCIPGCVFNCKIVSIEMSMIRSPWLSSYAFKGIYVFIQKIVFCS